MENTVYSLADFNVEIENTYGGIETFLKDYVTECENPDIEISVDDNDIAFENSSTDGEFKKPYLERLAVYRKFAEWLPMHNAFLMHGAVFETNGVGTILCAPSGTGKTTHMLLWKELLKDKFTVINGDKPIIRLTNDKFFAYGTPWCGKENLSQNKKTVLKNICFIKRSKTNFTETISKNDAVDLIFKQIYMPKSSLGVMKTLELADKLISVCNIYVINCNTDISAAKTAYSKIFKNGESI